MTSHLIPCNVGNERVTCYWRGRRAILKKPVDQFSETDFTKILELLRDSSDDKENQRQELVSATLLVAGSDKGKPCSAGS